ncbi:sigma 54-interacting transcriptional regulator [Bacillus sp. B190/17]|uniref:HTH-type transcriptional regulatory protein TyrR n=1 Tax=Bacillus lumedeiriae TaxID=3058829 RepID=A0ABW8IBR0_9BACI
MLESTANTRFEIMVNHLPFGVLTMDYSGLITTCNDTACQLLSLPISNIVNKTFTELFPLEERIEDLLAQTTHLEKKIQLGSHLFSLIVRKEKSLQEVICTLHPITEFPQESNKTLKSKLLNLPIDNILNACQDEIFITDAEGKTLFINSAGESLYGTNAQQLIGKDVFKLVEKGFFSPSLYPIIKQRQEKVSMIQRTKTGKTAHVIANPVFNEEGEMTNIIFTGRDITELKHLREKIQRSEVLLKTYQSELEELHSFHKQPADVIALSPKMRKIFKVVNKISRLDTTVLITGESGVGKGVIAKFIHDHSPRKEQPMIHINCGAIPDTLIESELFGYKKGAFTGANKEGKKGLIEQANGGTLFLDEIGEMPLHLQVKLLKALQERKIEPIGDSKSIDVDIRIITATNKDLKALVDAGKFRDDLYYRLNVVPIHIPPLRERPEDVSHMIDYFLNKMNKKYNLNTYLSLEVENTLTHHHWPGNVRELENLIERLVVTAEENEITMSDLPENIYYKETSDYIVQVNDICSLKQAQDQMEEQLIRKAYSLHTSSYKIADLLGINQSTAIRKIKKYIKKE